MYCGNVTDQKHIRNEGQLLAQFELDSCISGKPVFSSDFQDMAPSKKSDYFFIHYQAQNAVGCPFTPFELSELMKNSKSQLYSAMLLNCFG